MVYGTLDQVRMKRLAHATMTNIWNSIKGDWLKMKREWNEKIELAGVIHGIANPNLLLAKGVGRVGSGMSNIVLSTRTIDSSGAIKIDNGRSHNGNASVLDPVACEVILRFFMPTFGRKIYNPFGAGFSSVLLLAVMVMIICPVR